MNGPRDRPAGVVARFRHWRHRSRPKAAILRYHRVADLPADPFDHAVSPERFAEQIAMVRDRFVPTPLRTIAERRHPPRAVAITFDDGYRDVLDIAHPILAAAGLTATAFLVTGMLDGARAFWWDTLVRALLEPGRLPDRLTLPDGTGSWSLGSAARLEPADAARFRGWNWRVEAPTERHRVFRAVHDLLKERSDPERTALVDWIRQWAEIDAAPRPTDLPLTAAAVTRLRDDPTLAFGAHTVSHPTLTGLTPTRRREEIAGAKAALESLLHHPVTSFAYPYGRAARSRDMVEAAGYRCACTTGCDLVFPDSDPYRLPRVFVGNWPASTLERHLEALGL
ncbi:MAG: polysaccharide deacetylase family protein [Gemmatimonadetes bacterium]|nr:polysaccharide deacetylase family protein [Gemmatimonadota bacterium]